MAAIPTALTRCIPALVVLSVALLAACSGKRQESPPPAALETPAMCESRYPPSQPECLVSVILHGASTDKRQACVGEMRAYMQSIGQWRDCHLAIVQNDAALSDHDRNWMIDDANFYADHDLMKARANAACLEQGGGCEPY